MLPAASTAMARDELDEVTLARARRGDPAAFQALVEHYQDAVFRLLGRVLGRRGQPTLVEDLAQETFLGVFRGLPRFTSDGPARLSTWILTIATRTALKELRRPRLPWGRAVEVAAADRADLGAEQRALALALRRAIEQLRPAWRAVFVLREYHDFDYDEIARALDLDLGTVKSRLARAREQVRRDLEEYRG